MTAAKGRGEGEHPLHWTDIETICPLTPEAGWRPITEKSLSLWGKGKFNNDYIFRHASTHKSLRRLDVIEACRRGEHPLVMQFMEDVSLFASMDYVRVIAAELNRLHALEHDPMRKAAPALFEALEGLLDAIVQDTCDPDDDDADEDSVGWTDSGRMSLTFGMVRNARAALSQARGEAADA